MHLFIGTFLLDILAYVNGGTTFATMAQYLSIAGIAFALLAAIAGLIDFLYTVPPNSSAKKRGARHGLLNLSVVIIFIITAFVRDSDVSYPVIIALEAVAVVLLCVAGWMGGTLVYRNQIGVNPRYAEAGKWKEEYFQWVVGNIAVGDINELKINQMKLLHIGDKRIVLARTENGWAAFDDRCTHRGGSLAGGPMICSTVQCPWHGSQFDAHSGRVKAGPAKEPVRSYPVSESGGKVFVTIAQAKTISTTGGSKN